MPYTIRLLNEAREDIQETTDYLNIKRSKTGNKFFIAVAELIDVLSRNPLIFQKKYKEIRQVPLKKYSYMIHFVVDEDKLAVIVLAVLHTSRNPRIWKKREP